MKCGKLTAKLRDAVQVRFYENGREVKRYKNIKIPDAIKELEFTGFKFDVPDNGPITFKVFFKPGTLPETWPEARQRKTRTPKAADPEPMAEEIPRESVEATEDTAPEASADDTEDEPLPETMSVHYAVEGSARKALATSSGTGSASIRRIWRPPASPIPSGITPWIATAYWPAPTMPT